jgi:ligand-binding SRPBCC domain-containing protein
METLVAETRITGPPEPIWKIVSDPASLGALTPPKLGLSPIDTWPETLIKGQVIQFNIRTFGLPVLWACELVEVAPPRRIIAHQRTSPFRFWQFTETLYPVGNDTVVEDRMCYDLAGGSLTTAMTAPLLVPKLKQIIAFRQSMIRQMVESAPLPAVV